MIELFTGSTAVNFVKKKQAIRDEQVKLFTGSTAVNFVNTLNKPPLKLSLIYQALSTF